ncbi:hypothetical protein BDP27DRAFT_1364893 [Rhodocollybia butyracea]|uniref:Uncharacterized protein n=1 Tax=Rhodocollybia butyracea TaxID=206335 RepID=A0A9P5U725_9AGAR|nr:hypothetical protein BDP27DRAFT_1364893 [Rhodocollybia butyracea]
MYPANRFKHSKRRGCKTTLSGTAYWATWIGIDIQDEHQKALAASVGGDEVVEADNWDDIKTQQPPANQEEASDGMASPRVLRTKRKCVYVELASEDEVEVASHLTSSLPSPPQKKRRTNIGEIDLTNEPDDASAIDASSPSEATNDAANDGGLRSNGGANGTTADATFCPKTPKARSSPETEHWSPDYRVYRHQYSTWGMDPPKINF